MTQSNTFFCDDIFYIEGVGTIIMGTLTSGQIQIGMQAMINGKVSVVKTIEQSGKKTDYITQGITKAALLLSNVEKSDITMGNILFE